jgi:putative peptidoglycan lipid II flippase
MIKKLFSGQINSINMAALLVALSSLVSRFLGIFRDRILAGEFGAGNTLDVYYAAFRIPDLIFNLLVLGALSAGFIPIFTCLIKDQRCESKTEKNITANEEAWALANYVLNIMVIILFGLSLLGILFAPQIIKLITPGFSAANQAQVVMLSRIMFLSPILLGISGIFGGILQSFKRFFVYSLSPILYNIGIIIGALYLVPVFGSIGLAWGVVLGAFMHMLVQLPTAYKLGYHYLAKINLKNKNIKKIGVMMVARTMSLAISQINLLVITIIASTLTAGSLTIFNFANNLQSFPIGIFGISFAVAAFPTFSVLAFDREKLMANFSYVFRQILFFIIPATFLLFSLRAQIIRVILGTGQFDWEDTILTINTLGIFCISIFAQAAIPLLVRVFYARHDSKTPFFIGLASALLNIVLSLLLAPRFGIAGLTLAFSISSIINFIILWIFLHIELGGLDEAKIFYSTLKFSAAALTGGITVQAMKIFIWPYIDMTRVWGVFIQGFVAGLSGLFIYLAFCYILKSEEFFSLLSSIKKRLPWGKIETSDQGEARGI